MMITNKHKAYLILAITFLLGTLLGASGQYWLRSQSPSKPAYSPHETARELRERLSLEATQAVHVEQILNEMQQQYDELRTQMNPQVTEIRENARKRVREILKPEQLVRFEQWTREKDAKRAQEAQKKNAK